MISTVLSWQNKRISMLPITFIAEINPAGPNGSWTNFHTPFKTAAVFGKKGRVPVILEVAGKTFHTSTFPEPDGSGYIQFSKSMQQETGVKAGDRVEVTLTLDTAPRELETPVDLAAALDQNLAALAVWNKMVYSHKKEYAVWIDDAKHIETRQRRILKTVENLAAGKNLK
jgi:hypothetical protein